MKKVRRSAVLYYLLQGVAVAGWWIVLFAVPSARAYFQLETDSQTSLVSFWLADLVFVAGGSIAAAVLIYRCARYEVAAVWLVTGAISYAAVYTFIYTLKTDQGWLGVTLMLPAMLWSGVFATALTVKEAMFRQAKETSTNYVLMKTFSQIAVVWSLILVIFPYLITILEDKLDIARFEFAYQRPLSAILFTAISCLGVWAAFAMSKMGKGTPLPLDHAKELVVLGPYAYVRNPMALSGIGQGLMVALFLGSPLVALYALMGSLIWQLIFRPLEEDDLASRFGKQYEDYNKSVLCWVPRMTAYKSERLA